MAIKAEIYTWQSCPYCLKAKEILQSKDISLIEYSIDGDEMAHDAMTERANGLTTVPQIFVNDKHIGGCSDLEALDLTGKLDELLKAVI
jgi:glutaredoxin 3